MKENLIKKLKHIIFITAVLMFQNIDSKNLKPIGEDHCKEKKVTLKTEFNSRYRYFFFRKTNHKKVKRIDKVVDENEKTILKVIMRSTEKGDVYDFKEFHRLVIVGKEIHEVICVMAKEKGKLIVYNFCGEKVNQLNINTEELLKTCKF